MPHRAKLGLQIGAVCVIALLRGLLGWRLAANAEGRNVAAAADDGKRPPAPELSLPLLDGGDEVSLASYRGQAVVVNFWASWCVPCRNEAPLLEEASQRWRDRGVAFLGVNSQDFLGDARTFVERYGITYPNVHDGPGETLGRFGITGFPETYFLDAEGRIVSRVPAEIDAETLDVNIRLALSP